MSAFVSSIRSSSEVQLVGCNDFILSSPYGTKHHLLSTQLSAMRITPKITPALVSSTASTLTPSQLISSSSTIIITALILRILGLNEQSTKIINAASRMSIQLIIMGVFLLTPLFTYASTSPLKISIWISIVAAIASKEAVSRSKYTYKGQMRDSFIAILSGVGITLVHLLACIKAKINAQTIIPVAGMLFGNALSAMTLGMSSLLNSYLEERQMIELRLSRGANIREAALPPIRKAVETSLMPTINAMASTGLIFMPGKSALVLLFYFVCLIKVSVELEQVYLCLTAPHCTNKVIISLFSSSQIAHLSGMMSGQILGGQSPSQAASYQIMIYFAIATSGCLTSLILSSIVTTRMFNLHRQALVPWKLIPGLRKRGETMITKQQTSSPIHQSKLTGLNNCISKSLDERIEPLLRVQNLTVESTNLHIQSLEVNRGDRIGIRGRSGVGKTQLLRSLSRLDYNTVDNNETNMFLNGQSCNDIIPPQWRSQVIWVSQDRPTLSGTPKSFYNEILSYKCRHNQQSTHEESPIDITKQWGITAQTWNRPWTDISGGEAQRISLAIALSLQPKLLLLDEPSSNVDAITTMKIEKTLIDRNATVIIVSHSNQQLDRFCTSTIDLSVVV